VLGRENVLLANMPSIYNSQTTKGLAARLASNLGCLYTIVPIQEAVDLTVKQIGQTPVVDLQSGRQFYLPVSSFVVENIQARDRSARVLAGLAAAFGGGFTCNANKSEMTVGYTTLYGDQAGFLAALADLWKHQVYALARHINEHICGQEMIPGGIIDLVPSAELSFEQNVDKGKGDPIIYPYHDYLFRAFMEYWNRATPEDILEWFAEGVLEEKLGCEPGLPGRIFPSPREFIADLERWWRLYTGLGVAKRIQAPPVLAVSRRAYGFDHREAQNGAYFTARYLSLKEKLLRSSPAQ
jgi:NAD+ synthase (glutamine-hydrolysing)